MNANELKEERMGVIARTLSALLDQVGSDEAGWRQDLATDPHAVSVQLHRLARELAVVGDAILYLEAPSPPPVLRIYKTMLECPMCSDSVLFETIENARSFGAISKGDDTITLWDEERVELRFADASCDTCGWGVVGEDAIEKLVKDSIHEAVSE